MNDVSLIALDFRGTLDAMATWRPEQQQRLISVLQAFQQKRFKIVFVSNEEESSLQNFCQQQQLTTLIDLYKCPRIEKISEESLLQFMAMLQNENNYAVFAEKVLQLNDYAKYFNLAKENIYFFDDILQNVEAAMMAGYVNAKQVTMSKNLLQQLTKLAQQCNIEIYTSEQSAAKAFAAAMVTQVNSPKTETKIASNFLNYKKIFRLIKDCAVRPTCN